MNFINKINPQWPLRLGLGFMFLYSGSDIIRHPTAWYWALRPLIKLAPKSLTTAVNNPAFLNKFLLFQGSAELILALVFLAWFLPKNFAKWAAAIASLEMAAILVLIPIDAITFRDIGLLGGSLTLYLLVKEKITSSSPEIKEPKKVNSERGGEDKAIEPAVETYEEYMGHQKNN